MRRAAGLFAVALAIGVSLGLVWYFHDRFWWPADEGVYAYVAQRLLAGDVLHRDLIDLHGGYVNPLHALAFYIFGEDMLSLRYPLALLTVVQSVLAAALLWPRGRMAVAVAALATTAFSFIQFLNPSANWYALFLFFLTCWALTYVDSSRLPGTILLGFLFGLCFFFRQLSGVILAMGGVTWLLLNLPEGRSQPRLARALLAVMALGLGGYLWNKGSVSAWLLFGIWPLALLLVSLCRVRADDAAVLRLVLGLAAGAFIAAAPLVIYHAIEGTTVDWLRDVLFTALVIHEQAFIGQISFFLLLLGGVVGLGEWSNPASVLNGILWLALVGATPLLGWIILRSIWRGERSMLVHPLPILASFFALVSVHYQIPIYLWFGIAPVVLALLWRGSARSPAMTAGIVLVLAAIAIVYQAGQPLSRGLLGTIKGERVALDAPEGLPHASLKMERADQRIFLALLGHIAANARPSEMLFAFPMNPEFNFLTGRAAPVPYFATSFGLRNEADVSDALERLSQAAPLFVIYRREDKYLTPLSERLLREIRTRSPMPETFGPFELYRLPAPPAPPAPSLPRG